MSPITRAWIACAAIGAGLIYLALVAAASAVFGGVLAVMGVAGFAWGVLVLFDERFLAPRVSVIAVLVPIAVWLAADAAQVFLPLAAATVLELFIAAALAVHIRRGTDAAAPSTRRFVVGVAGGILVVSALVAPALAATTELAPVVPFEEGVHH